MSFWAEIRRRKVFQVAAVYAVVAWLLIQIVATIESPLQLPAWFDTSIIVLLLVGFPISIIFAWVYELSPGGLRRTPSAESLVSAESGDEEAPTREATAGSARPVLENSIAVLPFENMSPDPEHNYFAAGIHEEILNSLAKLKSLNVIARTSVLQYAETRQPISEIAASLGVETVMEGSVRYAGNRVRVTTQLIGAATGAHLWSEAYEREFEDIFAIQADIAVQVASALQAEFSSEERAIVATPATESAQAYALYLKALSLVARGGSLVSEYHELIDEALALDPKFALALGTKASLYAQELINSAGTVARSQEELEPLIKKYAAAALELDPRSHLAHLGLGVLSAFTWHWSEARDSFLRAFEVPQPGIFLALANWFLCWAGDKEKAVAMAHHIEQLNPADWTGPFGNGVVLNYAGRYDAAAAALRRSITIAPELPIHHSWLAWTEVARGEPVSALREVELTEKLLGEHREIIYLLDMSYAYSRIGDSANAQRLHDEIREVADAHDIGAGGWAMTNMAVKNYDEALKWLHTAAEKAQRHEIDAGMFSLMNLKLNTTNDPALNRPEFVEARERLKGA